VNRDLGRILCVAVPKISGGALQVFFNLLLIRHLSPEHFGMVSLCLTGIVMSDAVLGSALDMGILRLAPVYEQNGQRMRSVSLQKAALSIKPIGVALVTVPVMFLGSRLSQAFFQRSGGESLILLTLIGLLGLLMLRSAQLYYQVANRFVPYGLTDILQNALKFGGIMLLLAVATPTPERILMFYAIAPLSIALLTIAGSRELICAPLGRESLYELADVVRWYVATAAIGSISSRMDVFLVSIFSNVAEAGIFSAANAVAIVPQLCGTYMAVVYSPRIMPLWEQGRLFAVFKTFQRNLVLACVGIYIIAAAGLSQFGTWLLPQNFARSSSVILVLLPAALCGLVNFPWTVSLLLFMPPPFLLVFEAASFVLLVPLYGYVVPAWGAIGGAAVSTGFALLKTFVYQSVAWRVLRSQPGTVPEQSTFLVPKELRT